MTVRRCGNQMRKQQWRTAKGGAVVRVRSVVCTDSPNDTGAWVQGGNKATTVVAITIGGTLYVSDDCGPAWQWAWHRLGCTWTVFGAIGSAHGKSAPANDATSVPFDVLPGQTWLASARCMNSRLSKANNATDRRLRRRVIMM